MSAAEIAGRRIGRRCPTPSTCRSYGRCMPIINVQCGLNPYEPGHHLQGADHD